MSKVPQSLASEPAADRDPSPPRGLERWKKSEFARVCRMRRAAGRPVLEIETDTICDWIHARERLISLQNILVDHEAETSFDLGERLRLVAAIDRAAAGVNRLARDLRLVG